MNAGIPQPRLHRKMQSDRPGFGDSFFKTSHPSIEPPGIPGFLVFVPFDSSLPLICPWVTNHPNLMPNDTDGHLSCSQSALWPGLRGVSSILLLLLSAGAAQRLE